MAHGIRSLSRLRRSSDRNSHLESRLILRRRCTFPRGSADEARHGLTAVMLTMVRSSRPPPAPMARRRPAASGVSPRRRWVSLVDERGRQKIEASVDTSGNHLPDAVERTLWCIAVGRPRRASLSSHKRSPPRSRTRIEPRASSAMRLRVRRNVTLGMTFLLRSQAGPTQRHAYGERIVYRPFEERGGR